MDKSKEFSQKSAKPVKSTTPKSKAPKPPRVKHPRPGMDPCPGCGMG